MACRRISILWFSEAASLRVYMRDERLLLDWTSWYQNQSETLFLFQQLWHFPEVYCWMLLLVMIKMCKMKAVLFFWTWNLCKDLNVLVYYCLDRFLYFYSEQCTLVQPLFFLKRTKKNLNVKVHVKFLNVHFWRDL